MHVFLERAAFTVDVQHVDRTDGDPTLGVPAEVTSVQGAAVRFTFGTPSAVTPGLLLPGTHTFLLGNDRSRWCGDVPAYASVRYETIAPDIALEAYSKDGHFEYDLLANPGADLRQVTIEVTGAEGLAVGDDGLLTIATQYGPIVQSAPIAFAGEGQGRRVTCHIELRGPHAFGFVASDWDGHEPLRIDPGLTYGTYLGGSAADSLTAVAVGIDGVLTLAGGASSMNFPVTPGAYQSAPNGSDCLILRLDPRLSPASQILSSTWYGGGGTDNFTAVSVDEQGIATLFGNTRSSDLPTTPNAFSATFGGGTFDAILTRFDLTQAGAQQLLYATYIGGSGNEFVSNSILVEGNIVIFTGSTLSANYPTTANAWSQTYAGGGGTDGILTRIDISQPPASQLVYSSYFGSTGADAGSAIALDPVGRVAIFGTSSSATFPVTANAYDSTLGGPGDTILALFDLTLPPAQQIVYATYFGGNAGDTAPAMQIDRNGAFCICGHTFSTDFSVTANAFDTTFATQDAYFARLDPSLAPANQLTYSTFVGGTAAESATSLLVDAAGVITMSGGTTSTDFPVTDGAFQATNGGGFQDTWVVRIDPARPPAEQLLYSTYLGGDGLESLFCLAMEEMGGVWAVGFTQSTNFPTTPNGVGGSPNGANDAFVAHLDMLPTGVSAYGSSSPGCNGPIVASVTSMPRVGNMHFAMTCTNMTPPAIGLIGISLVPAVFPTTVLGIDVWVDTTLLQTVFLATTNYGAQALMPIPADAGLIGLPIAAQFAWYEGGVGSTCPSLGWSASHALYFLVQP